MTTLILDNNKTYTFSTINELKFFVFEKFWYPENEEETDFNEAVKSSEVKSKL